MSGTTTKVAFPGTLPTLAVTRQTVLLGNNDVALGVPNSNGQVTAGSIADLALAGSYVLPAASTTVRGGIKVDGVTCTISAGDVLSVVSSGGGSTGLTSFMGRSTAAAVITAQDVNGVVAIPVASSAIPLIASGSGGAGVSAAFAKGDHYHPASSITLAQLPQTGATTGQAMIWNGTVWGPGSVATTLASLPQTGATTGQAVVWNGTIWAPGTVSGGGGSGTNVPAAPVVTSAAGTPTVVINSAGTSGTTQQIAFSDFVNAITLPIGSYSAAAAVTGTNQWLIDQGGASMVAVTATQLQTFVRKGDNPSLTYNWSQGGVTVNGTIKLIHKAGFGFTIDSLDYDVGSAGGSFTVAVQITHSGSATSVTGLSAVAVSSSTTANAAASAAKTVVAGDMVTFVISSTSGSPTGGTLGLNLTRT